MTCLVDYTRPPTAVTSPTSNELDAVSRKSVAAQATNNIDPDALVRAGKQSSPGRARLQSCRIALADVGF